MIGLIIMLILLGAVLYIVQLLPIDHTIQQVIRVIAVVAMVIYVLQFFFYGGGDVRIPR